MKTCRADTLKLSDRGIHPPAATQSASDPIVKASVQYRFPVVSIKLFCPLQASNLTSEIDFVVMAFEVGQIL